MSYCRRVYLFVTLDLYFKYFGNGKTISISKLPHLQVRKNDREQIKQFHNNAVTHR